MNFYKIFVLVFLVMIFAHFFNVVEPVSVFVKRIADIPTIDDYGKNPALFKLVLRLAYFIALISVIKMILARKSDD